MRDAAHKKDRASVPAERTSSCRSVPTDIYEQVMLVNKTLLSSISRLRACVPSELLNRLHLQ